MLESTLDSFTAEVAGRFAASAAQAEGVAGVTVCAREGSVVTGAGRVDVRREGAMASFVAQRAEALAEDGDLRGMGKAVAMSQLQEIVLSGANGDAVLLSLPECYVFASLHAGANPHSVTASLRVIAGRYF